MFWRYSSLFIVLTFMVGTVFWFCVDEDFWWATITTAGGQHLRKFKATSIEQATVSCLIGAFIAAPATAAVLLSRQTAHYVMRRKLPAEPDR
jgi:hypothetical protein